MKITLSPTGRFETVNQGNGRVQCRIWEGTTTSGAKIIAHIPLIGVHKSATEAEQLAFEKALREIETERQLVSFDMRKALVACAPLAHAAITACGGNERLGYIGGTGHPSPDEPVTVTITTTVGALREARRALFVIAMEPPRTGENGCGNG